MIILGISEGFHDASVSVIKNEEVLFAGHAERYSKIKNDPTLNYEIIQEAVSHGAPDKIAYYENPILKKARLILRGGLKESQGYLKQSIFKNIKVENVGHHRSHAAAGYYTSKFTDATIVVLDAIGEFNTSTIWHGHKDKIKLMYKQNYPVSYGLFYSAFTSLIGLKPNQEEYIMMGMAGYGNADKYFDKVNKYFPIYSNQKYNFHKGIFDWDLPVLESDRFDIAAAVQQVYENRLMEFMRKAQMIVGSKNLVFMGGCALNCSANTKLWDVFNNIWIMPNPGDAGSSLGAAASVYGKHINWKSPYLGTNIIGQYPVDSIIQSLVNNKIAPVVSGRAEFGPRSLGNRSILADPRDPNIKDKVNKIKQRELFRPFAPVVMEEYASEWFDMNYSSPYMQFAPKCIKPDLIPSVVHIDGTSRVQTVNSDQHPGLYKTLEKWYKITGVPVLLNTSLNIKGQPILNNENDIINWESTYGERIIK
jgi:carbamoyltransferase